MSQGLLGLCCLIETRDRIEIITLAAIFFGVATLGIYCTDFLPQLLAQVKYPMQFGWASYLSDINRVK